MIRKNLAVLVSKKSVFIIFSVFIVYFISAGAKADDTSGFESLQFSPLGQSKSANIVSTAKPTIGAEAVDNEFAKSLKEILDNRKQAVSLSAQQTSNKQGPSSGDIGSGKEIRKNIKKDFKVHLNKGTGVPRQIKHQERGRRPDAVLQEAVVHLAPGKERDMETARAFLKSKGGLLRLTDPENELQMSGYNEDRHGRKHIRYQQKFKGLDVWPAELNVHLDQYGNVDLVDGASIPTPMKMVTQPVWTVDDALAIALREISDGYDAEVKSQELIVYAQNNKPPRLAWKLNLVNSVYADWLVVVDAQNGSILSLFNRVKNADVPGSGTDMHGVTQSFRVWQEAASEYYMVDTSKAMFNGSSNPPSPETTQGGIIILDAQGTPADPFSQSPDLYYVDSTNNTWPIQPSVSTMYALSKTYDYYKTVHGRNSIDNQGMNIVGTVRMGPVSFENAFWSDQFKGMFFGSGDYWGGALDLTAHEYTHGVTSYTAKLVYKDQAGALNEAFSDIFGESVEAWVTSNNHDWKCGTQLSAPIRDMKNPSSMSTSFGPYPSKMSEYINTTQDNGGVHLNSSIINHAYYLLAEGLTGAIGITEAEKIFYDVLTNHMVQNSQFVDLRLACIASAETLYGASSTEAQKVAEAFDAVGIITDTQTPEPPPFTPVSGDDSLLFVWSSDYGSSFILGRRETALNDDSTGNQFSGYAVKDQRPAVAGDGSWALFVDTWNDLCWKDTNSNDYEVCSGAGNFQGWVHSVAMSPDQKQYAFVFLDSQYGSTPTNRINLYSDATGQWSEYNLASTIHSEDTINQEIWFADAMDFTADSKFLIYDAYNVVTLPDASKYGAWSIYALEIATGQVYTLVPPIPGYDFGNPALSQTTHNFITFDGIEYNTNTSAVFAMNLNSGVFGIVGGNNPGTYWWAVPSYTGDDSAIVYSYPDSVTSNYLLASQNLNADRITPSGTPTTYLVNGKMGVVYRRGTFVKPQANIEADPPNVNYRHSSVARTTAQQVVITNTGTSDLKIKSIAITGPDAAEFSMQSNCEGQTLPGTGSCTVKVTHTPLTEGIKSATLTVQSDDPSTPLLDIPLRAGASEFPWPMFLPAIIGVGR